MDNLEKVERLREKADVTYDEAKRALEACNWDMLDAMIYLESLGKVKKTSDTDYYSSKTKEDKLYDVEKTIKDEERRNKEESFKNSFKRGFDRFIKICKENHFIVKHEDKKVIDLPLGIALIIFLIGWHVLLIVMLISLFFECKYSIEGKNNLKTVNSAMDKAAETAGRLKREFEDKTEDKSEHKAEKSAEDKDVKSAEDEDAKNEL
ncbi:MAG: hypothetical protein IIY49_09415 [Eubacterium sp.]|nr:hypothetical protein [Eubacterium sp.]